MDGSYVGYRAWNHNNNTQDDDEIKVKDRCKVTTAQVLPFL